MNEFFSDQDFFPPLIAEPSVWDACSLFPLHLSSVCPSGELLPEFPQLPAYSPLLVRSGSSKRQAEPEEGEDLKRKRLARKAELAREGRKRKKERITELEKQLADMQLELDREKRRNHAAINVTSSGADRAKASIGGILQTIPLGSACAQMYNVNVQSVHPCLFIRFLQWILTQHNNFYCDPASLWFSLFLQEVRVSANQFDQLFNLHQECIDTSFSSFSGLDEQSHFLNQTLHHPTHMLQRFMHILTSPQLIVFFQWVERYGDVCLKIKT